MLNLQPFNWKTARGKIKNEINNYMGCNSSIYWLYGRLHLARHVESCRTEQQSLFLKLKGCVIFLRLVKDQLWLFAFLVFLTCSCGVKKHTDESTCRRLDPCPFLFSNFVCHFCYTSNVKLGLWEGSKLAGESVNSRAGLIKCMNQSESIRA